MTHTISPVAGKPRYDLVLFAVIGILVVLYFLAASAGFDAVLLRFPFVGLSVPPAGHDTSTSGGGLSGSRCPGPVEDSDDADRAACQPIPRGIKKGRHLLTGRSSRRPRTSRVRRSVTVSGRTSATSCHSRTSPRKNDSSRSRSVF